MSGVQKKALADLQKVTAGCTRCALHSGRTNMVFGAGNEDAELMLVGEGPGRQEDLLGLPFVGPAGKLLDRLLTGVGLSRDEVYITNVVKCRPPGNRDPHPDESRSCDPILKKQLEIIRPLIICALGRIASGILLKRTVQITRMHGMLISVNGYNIVPVFHPAAALRGGNAMSGITEDFQKLKEYLENAPRPAPDRSHGPGTPVPEQLELF